ncbi:MAG: outer membrane lipoprotein chaperone LolA [Rhodocyclaceae bacterium]|nr:outer membrane lipoprotein chaperone LolA [Rhodocyclaceae bacterium]
MNGILLRGLLALVLWWSVCAYAQPSGVEQLRQFIERSTHAQGRFEQVVTASSGRRPQLASGRLSFLRPGRFRWEYETPYAQLLVSDGERMWAWDRDLNQVTVKKVGDALGSSPAAILAGDGDLDRDFELREAASEDGLEWVEIVPKQADSGFASMRVGLTDGRLRRMEMRDHFGQTTRIDFIDLDLGVRPESSLFSFVPPAGADVIGD